MGRERRTIEQNRICAKMEAIERNNLVKPDALAYTTPLGMALGLVVFGWLPTKKGSPNKKK